MTGLHTRCARIIPLPGSIYPNLTGVGRFPTIAIPALAARRCVQPMAVSSMKAAVESARYRSRGRKNKVGCTGSYKMCVRVPGNIHFTCEGLSPDLHLKAEACPYPGTER